MTRRFWLLSMLVWMVMWPAAAQTVTRTFPFDLKTPARLDLMVGEVKIIGFALERDVRDLTDFVLPPRGGETRFSWLLTTVQVENSSKEQSFNVKTRVRLLDQAGAVVDEYEFAGRSWRQKVRDLTLKRLALNYVLPLIKQTEVTITVEP